jgi:hypothetical protein
MTALEILEARCKDLGFSLRWEVERFSDALHHRLTGTVTGPASRESYSYYYTTLEVEHAKFDLLDVILTKLSTSLLA